MKRILLFFLLTSSYLTMAQETERLPGHFNVNKTNIRNNIISLSPFHLLGSQFNLNLERNFPSVTNFSIRFSGGFALAENPSGASLATRNSVQEMHGFMGEIQPRFYLNAPERAMNSFYFAPYFLYRNINFRTTTFMYYDPYNPYYPPYVENAKVRAHSYSGGLLIGYQIITYSRFTLDLFTGGGFTFAESNVSGVFSGAFSPYIKGIKPRLGFNIGVAF